MTPVKYISNILTKSKKNISFIPVFPYKFIGLMTNNAVVKHFCVIWKGNIWLSTRKHLAQSDVGVYAYAR